MNNNKKKIKGSVLYTVVAVMSILIVFCCAALSLAASANRRAHNKYADYQTQYTARSVVETLLSALNDNEEFAKQIAALGDNSECTIDISGIDKSMGTIKSAKIANLGQTYTIGVDVDGDPSTQDKQYVYKLTAEVTMLGQENTVSLYCYNDKSTTQVAGVFKNSLTSMGGLMMSNAGGVYTGDVYSHINGKNPNNDVYINKKFELIGSYGTDSNLGLIAGADIKIEDYGKGIYIGRNLKLETYSNFDMKFDKKVENINYRQLPYAFIGNTIESINKFTIGDVAHPFIVMADAIDGITASNGSKTFVNDFDVYGDVYLYSTDQESYISAGTGNDGVEHGVHQWDSNQAKINEQPASGYPYTGGNIYSLGTINVVNNNVRLANNVVADTIKFHGGGTNNKTDGTVVAKTIDMTDDNAAASEWKFNGGLFAYPENFTISNPAQNPPKKINDIPYTFEQFPRIGWDHAYTYSLNQNDENVSVWRADNNTIHSLDFKLTDFWDGVFWNDDGSSYMDPNRSVFVVPQNFMVTFERNTSEMDDEAIQRGDFIRKLIFNNGIEIELFENGNSIGTAPIMDQEIKFESQTNFFQINLPSYKMTDSGKLSFKLTGIESGCWEKVPMVTEKENSENLYRWEHKKKVDENGNNILDENGNPIYEYETEYDWQNNTYKPILDKPIYEKVTGADYTYHWKWNKETKKWDKVDGAPDTSIDPRFCHPENCYWEEGWGEEWDGSQNKNIPVYKGEWKRIDDKTYDYETKLIYDDAEPGGNYSIRYRQTDSINSIKVQSIKVTTYAYEDKSTYNSAEVENFLKQVNDKVFDVKNPIVITDIDKTITITRVLNSETGDGTLSIQNSQGGSPQIFNYKDEYANFLKAVVDTVTFPESMQKNNVLKTPPDGFVDTSFLSQQYNDQINNNAWTYYNADAELDNTVAVEDELKDVPIYCGLGNPIYFKIEPDMENGNIAKDGKMYMEYEKNCNSDINDPESENALIISENCILTEQFINATIIIDPAGKDLYIGLYALNLKDSKIIVEDGLGKGKVYFFVPKNDIGYRRYDGGYINDTLTGPVWGIPSKQQYTNSDGTEFYLTNCGNLDVSGTLILTRTYYKQLNSGSGDSLKIYSKTSPPEGDDNNYVPNIYLYMDYKQGDMGLSMVGSLISGYIMAPTTTAFLYGAKAYDVTYDGKTFMETGKPQDTKNNICVIGSAIFGVTHFSESSSFMYIDDGGSNSSPPDDENNVGTFYELYSQAA